MVDSLGLNPDLKGSIPETVENLSNLESLFLGKPACFCRFQDEIDLIFAFVFALHLNLDFGRFGSKGPPT